jgi:hypothetical protein
MLSSPRVAVRLVSVAIAASALLAPSQALAIVGGVRVASDSPISRFTVRIESGRGQLCTGVVIDARTVLSAAHCVLARTRYRVIARDRAGRPVTIAVENRIAHPSFLADRSPMTQPGVDLAVLRLAQALPDNKIPAPFGGWGTATLGQGLVIAGYGLGQEGKPASARILRQARLVSTGAFASANSVLVAVDENGKGQTPGAGACRGDSGGPILSEGAGGSLVGIVSWSSAPSLSTGRRVCGGYTALTPLSGHMGWINEATTALARQP